MLMCHLTCCTSFCIMESAGMSSMCSNMQTAGFGLHNALQPLGGCPKGTLYLLYCCATAPELSTAGQT